MMQAAVAVRLTRLEARAALGVILLALALSWGCGVAAAAPEGDYHLSSGDVLVLTVFGDPDLSGKVAIGPTGTASFPLIGTQKLAALTLDDARVQILRALKDVIRTPHLTLTLDELASERKVYATGYVGHPGPIALPFGATIADALAAALPLETADLRRVRMTHPGEAAQELDMSGFRAGTALNVLEKVRYGDVVYVPKLEDEITILGEVAHPGASLLPVDHDVTVVDALGKIAGGLTATADRTSATLLRKGQKPVTIDLKRLLTEGDPAENLVLKAGDTLVLREAGKIAVLGEVGTPRTFDAPEPVNVLEALAAAGGATKIAGPEKARILRAGGTEESVDIRALIRQGNVTQNLMLRAGDALIIPEAEPETVLFIGAVKAPGTLSIRDAKQKDALRLLTLVSTTPTADLARVSILRGDKRVPVNLYRMLHDGDLSSNCDLEVGDVVWVPEMDRMYALGALNRQGELPVEPGMRIIDALSRSGGFLPNADANAAVLVRTKADGTAELIKVRLADLQRGNAPEPTQLQPGDILYVPQRGAARFTWDVLRDAIWFAGGIWALVRH